MRHLLGHEIHVCFIFEVFVELDNVRVVLLMQTKDTDESKCIKFRNYYCEKESDINRWQKEQEITKLLHPCACATLYNAILTSCCKILTSVWKRSQFLIFDRAITLTARLYPVSICVQAVTSPYVPLPNY